jgi:Zn-dependent protease with chaperone function
VRFITIAVLVLLAATLTARAQEPAPPTADGAPPAASGAPAGAGLVSRTSAGPAAEAPPTLVDNPLGPVPPDDPRSEAYAHGGYALYFAGKVFSLLLLWAILATGMSAWMQRLATRVGRRPGLTVAAYAVLFALVGFVAGLPLGIYAGFVREKRYGFMNQSFASWMGDEVKGLAIAIVVQAFLFPVLYRIIRRTGRAWWLPGAAVVIACVLIGAVIAPVFIAPLFNTYTPLEDESLRRDILDMAHAQGIPADEVYQVDASRQSGHTNAYVTGLFGTQRIVLYDTLLKRYTPREIRFIMGHEMGHYVMHHVLKTVAFIGIFIVLGLWIVDRWARRVIHARPAWGIGGLEQPASLPLILLLLSLVSIVVRPAVMTWSRWQEHSSDRFGLDIVRDPEAAASSFRKFSLIDLSEMNVNPAIEFLLYTHPSGAHRIRYAQQWAAGHGVTAPTAGGAPAPGGTPAGGGVPGTRP